MEENMRKLIKVLFVLVIMSSIVGCVQSEKIEESDDNYPIISPFTGNYGETTKIYFPKKNENKLSAEERLIENRNKSYEEIVLDELLKGPESSEYRNIIPSGLEVLSVNVIGQIAYLNFSDEFIKTPYNESEELLLVYSIVNTMAELDKVTRVQFLVNGDRAEFINKYIQLSEPLDPSQFIQNTEVQTPSMVIREYYRKYREGQIVTEYHSDENTEVENSISKDEMWNMEIQDISYNKYSSKMNVKVELKKANEKIIQNIDLVYEKDRGFKIVKIED
jgi:hypothetical protein